MLNHLTKRVVPLVFTFTLSALVTTSLTSSPRQDSPVTQAPLQVGGSGSASCGDDHLSFSDAKPEASKQRGSTAPYRVTFQPKAVYTDAARANGIEGGVRLKITLRPDGTVGNITAVTTLPDGLTEQAIAAARQIRFEPKTVNGVPVPVVVTREYVFTIY